MNAHANARNEKRRALRIPNSKLPASLKKLTVSIGDAGEDYVVSTIDASVSGIAFKLDKPAHLIQDYDLTIRGGNPGFRLRDELVYVKPIDANTSRVSVHFSQQLDLGKYIKQVKDAI